MPILTPSDSWQVSPEAALLDRVRAGDTALYEVLMRRYERPLRSLVRRVLGNDDEVDDVLQEAHLRAFTRLDQFAGRSSFYAWLARIAINEALGRLRSRRRFPLLNGISVPADHIGAPFVSRVRDPEKQACYRELHQAIRSALATLPERYRTVFKLRAIDELDVLEAASRLGVSSECVKTRLHRARRLLRKRLHRCIGHAAGANMLAAAA